MPPTRHSGSSFSSSRSSSSFSSRSSSSRPSSHSSSSFSSPFRSSSSGPSSHSSSSFSRPFSSPSPSHRPASNPKPASSVHPYASAPARRPRVNQPRYSDMILPILRMCNNHDYMYFEKPWDYEGKHYAAGYYDENGNYYKEVAFKEDNGKTMADLECEYCGNRARYELVDGNIPTCENCGAPMKLAGVNTDTLKSEQEYSTYTNYTAEAPAPKKSWIRRHPILTFIGLVLICSIIKNVVSAVLFSSDFDSFGSGYQQMDTRSNPEIFGNTLYLTSSGKGTYVITDKANATLKLKWDSDAEGYYDPNTECWAWYNNETSTGVWQYWYEGHSSKYDSGWMEYVNGKWKVEKTANNWIEYPGNTSKFWHIAD